MHLHGKFIERVTSISRAVLIAKLKENRAKHEAEYTEAINGYGEQLRQHIEEQFDELVKNATNRKKEMLDKLPTVTTPEALAKGALDMATLLTGHVNCMLPVPKSYLAIYDKAIGLFEIEHDDVVKLSGQEVDQYVFDEFDWKEEHNATMAFYNSKKA